MPKMPIERHPVTQPLDKPFRLIPLTQGQNAIVDAEDFDWLSQWPWCAIKRQCGASRFYAVRMEPAPDTKKRQKMLGMHTALMGKHCDHKNLDGLDNRKLNLRKCTRSQNSCNKGLQANNTSGYKGVHFVPDEGGKWRAIIYKNHKKINLGNFYSKKEAAIAYDDAARVYHGAFARLNFI